MKKQNKEAYLADLKNRAAADIPMTQEDFQQLDAALQNESTSKSRRTGNCYIVAPTQAGGEDGTCVFRHCQFHNQWELASPALAVLASENLIKKSMLKGVYGHHYGNQPSRKFGLASSCYEGVSRLNTLKSKAPNLETIIAVGPKRAENVFESDMAAAQKLQGEAKKEKEKAAEQLRDYYLEQVKLAKTKLAKLQSRTYSPEEAKCVHFAEVDQAMAWCKEHGIPMVQIQ